MSNKLKNSIFSIAKNSNPNSSGKAERRSINNYEKKPTLPSERKNVSSNPPSSSQSPGFPGSSLKNK